MSFLLLLLALLCAAPAPVLAKTKSPATKGVVAPLDLRATHDQLITQVAAEYDTSKGGWVTKGQPVESAVELAFQIAREKPDSEWKGRALGTVDWMHALLDTIGGGFVGSLAEQDHEISKFEKRTVPNARRLENLIDAWQISGDLRYRRDAERVVDFFERVLLDARGGFITDQVGDRDLQPAANGVAMHAYLRWAEVTGNRRFLNFALKSADRVYKNCWDDAGVLLRRGTFGEVLQYPQLDDQVEMGRGLVLAYQLGKRPVDLERARAMGELLIARFQDPRGGFRTQSAPTKKGEVKKAARESGENAAAARFLCELATASGDAKYREAAKSAWAPFREDLAKAGLESADWALAARADFAPTEPRVPDWQVVESIPATTQPRTMRFRPGKRR